MANITEDNVFDIIKKLFTDRREFNNVSDFLLNRNSFMINRFIAIKYPDKVQCFNNTKVNQVDVCKFWADYLGGQYRVPSFIYTKGAKRSQETKSKIQKMPSDALINEFCIYYKFDKKDVLTALKMFKDDMINEINEYVKIKSLKDE